jgi:helix-turn-helix protein
MNRFRPHYLRRVRLFCELPIGAVSRATGISENRIAGIETGQRAPNDTELRLIQRFLAARLRMVLESDGPAPSWLRAPSSALTEVTR